MTIGIVGPFSYLTLEERDKYVEQARQAAIQLMYRGHAVYCPHTMYLDMEFVPGLEHEDFMRSTLAIIPRLEAIYLLPGWEYSRNGGCQRERDTAERAGCQVYEQMEDVPDGRET